MSEEPVTFGRAISAARRKLGMSQKQLAERIQREEGGSISPQYLNDIEHDRRSPSSDHMIRQFSRALDLSENYLCYVAGRVPAELRRASMSPAQVEEWVTAFRRNPNSKKRR
jgi:transcriptional regulator with XRE-family HTH domain